MAISIDTGPDVYYTDTYKTLIRSNREYLLSMCHRTPIVRRDWLMACQNDFYRFLEYYPEVEIPLNMLWTIAFLNDITDPHQYIGDLKEWLNIDIAVIEKMIIRQNTKFK